jgi:DNA-binding MarR family transcriptional regulator
MHLVLSVLTTARSIERAATRVFRPHGLTTAQFNVLTVLSRNPGGMRASSLADALVVDPSNVTGLLKRMTKEGLVAELENRADRRRYNVGLSPKGLALWGRADADYQVCLRKVLAPISNSALNTAGKVLASLEAGAATLP